jgi:hypothetical protein
VTYANEKSLVSLNSSVQGIVNLNRERDKDKNETTRRSRLLHLKRLQIEEREIGGGDGNLQRESGNRVGSWGL